MSEIHETIGELKAKVKAAHDRVDKLESGLREDLEKIMSKLGTIEQWMHKKQGSEATWILVASIVSGLLSFLATKFL